MYKHLNQRLSSMSFLSDRHGILFIDDQVFQFKEILAENMWDLHIFAQETDAIVLDIQYQKQTSWTWTYLPFVMAACVAAGFVLLAWKRRITQPSTSRGYLVEYSRLKRMNATEMEVPTRFAPSRV
jgi:hypothetical protein